MLFAAFILSSNKMSFVDKMGLLCGCCWEIPSTLKITHKCGTNTHKQNHYTQPPDTPVQHLIGHYVTFVSGPCAPNFHSNEFAYFLETISNLTFHS